MNTGKGRFIGLAVAVTRFPFHILKRKMISHHFRRLFKFSDIVTIKTTPEVSSEYKNLQSHCLWRACTTFKFFSRIEKVSKHWYSENRVLWDVNQHRLTFANYSDNYFWRLGPLLCTILRIICTKLEFKHLVFTFFSSAFLKMLFSWIEFKQLSSLSVF